MLVTTETLLGPSPPSSAYLESFRVLRTALLALQAREPFKSILITSALPREGKTTVALNLATVLALAGKRTIVADGDADQQSLGRLLGIRGTPGLTDLCQKTLSVDAALLPTELEALRAVSVGTLPRLTAELAAKPSMGETIRELAGQSEFLVMDAVPTLGFSTALSLGPMFDLVLVVARARGQAGLVRQTLAALLDVGAKVGGVVVNDILPQDSVTATSYYRYYSTED